MVRHGKHSSSQTENLLYILMSLEMYQILSSHNSVTEDSSLTQPLPDQSYDQSFIKKTSIQVTIKIFSCCIFDRYLVHLFIFHWRNAVLIILQQKNYFLESPLDLLEISFSPMNDKFDLWPDIQEGVLFVGWVVLVVGMLCRTWRGTDNTLPTSELVAVERTVTSPGFYTPGETTPIPIKYSWVRPRASMDAFKKK